MLFPLVMCTLSGCGVFTGTTGDGDGNDADRDTPKVQCGFNAVVDGEQCECVDHYEWCDNAREDCCAFGAESFTLTINDVVIAPYNYLFYDEPWDWDGDVPDWIFEALEILGELYPEAQTVGELLALVEEYAPELLAGVVPPDVFFEVYGSDDEVIYTSRTIDDEYEAPFRESFRLTADSRGTSILFFYDEDLAFDDEVQAFEITGESLAYAAGRGPIEGAVWGNVYWLNIEVQANFR